MDRLIISHIINSVPVFDLEQKHSFTEQQQRYLGGTGNI
jgi:hypothetical protein